MQAPPPATRRTREGEGGQLVRRPRARTLSASHALPHDDEVGPGAWSRQRRTQAIIGSRRREREASLAVAVAACYAETRSVHVPVRISTIIPAYEREAAKENTQAGREPPAGLQVPLRTVSNGVRFPQAILSAGWTRNASEPPSRVPTGSSMLGMAVRRCAIASWRSRMLRARTSGRICTAPGSASSVLSGRSPSYSAGRLRCSW